MAIPQTLVAKMINGNQGGGRLQATRAHHAVFAASVQSFEAYVTEISIIPAGTIVALWRGLRNNEWEVLVRTCPLLRNVRHKAMIAPVSPLSTKLIHISPSYWTIYHSFEIILEWGTVHWLGIRSQYSMQIYCFKKHSIWYEFYFKKIHNRRGQLTDEPR